MLGPDPMGGYLADREVLTAADWRQNMQLPFACVERLSLSLVGEGFLPLHARRNGNERLL